MYASHDYYLSYICKVHSYKLLFIVDNGIGHSIS
jgi:hypothetical protein